jgi:hypothetical protein
MEKESDKILNLSNTGNREKLLQEAKRDTELKVKRRIALEMLRGGEFDEKIVKYCGVSQSEVAELKELVQ